MDLVPKEYKQKALNAGGGGLSKFNVPSVSQWKSGFSEETRNAFMKYGVLVGFVLLALVLLAWGGLKFYQKSLLKQSAGLQEQYAKVFSAQDKTTASQIIDFQKKGAKLQQLLKSHLYTSESFNILAAATLPQVQWQSYDLSVETRKVSLKGLAVSYFILAKQMLALEEAGFSGIEISGITLDNAGGVAFGVSFNFDPKILQK
jgi:hypothetical protein